jgi:hypothetical protein
MSKLHSVLPPASEAAFLGDEPTWSELVSEEKYNSELSKALNWHNYCASDKDYQKYMEQWIREHRSSSAKRDIEAFRKLSFVNKTICALARIHLQGFPLKSKDSQHIRNYIMEFTGISGKKVTTQTSTKVRSVPSIQERIRAQVASILSDLDVRVDDAFEDNLATPEDISGDILSQNFKGPQLKLIQDYLNRNLIEWIQAYSGDDEQLAQGYKYIGRRNLKKIIDTFTQVMDTISQQSTRIKTQRIRKKKPVDKKKMASKLRFMKDFPELNIQSLNPVDIIGANMIWVYDTKKRRLGYYEAELKNSLFVKGTKIEGFKVTCEKILRKPEEQIPEIMKLRKNQTVNWFDGIRAKCKDMTGRTNTNLILLRID